MTVQELINKLIVLDLDKEIYIEDTFNSTIGSFNLELAENDYIFSPDGEWVRMKK